MKISVLDVMIPDFELVLDGETDAGLKLRTECLDTSVWALTLTMTDSEGRRQSCTLNALEAAALRRAVNVLADLIAEAETARTFNPMITAAGR